MNYFERQRAANEIRTFALHLAEQQPKKIEPRFWSAVLSDDGSTVAAYFKIKGWPHRLKRTLTGSLDEIKNELIRLTIHLPETAELEPIKPDESHPQSTWDFVEREFDIKRNGAESAS